MGNLFVSEKDITKFVRSKDAAAQQSMVTSGIIKDVNVRDVTWDNGTALMNQSCFGTIDGVRFLLDCNPPADPNLWNQNGWTALYFAVWRGKDNSELVQLLLDRGADKSLKTIDGQTALDLAKKNDMKRCIAALENHG